MRPGARISKPFSERGPVLRLDRLRRTIVHVARQRVGLLQQQACRLVLRTHRKGPYLGQRVLEEVGHCREVTPPASCRQPTFSRRHPSPACGRSWPRRQAGRSQPRALARKAGKGGWHRADERGWSVILSLRPTSRCHRCLIIKRWRRFKLPVARTGAVLVTAT